MKHFPYLLLLLSAFWLGSPANAQETEVANCTQKKVSFIIEKTGSSCEEILALHQSGFGYGEMVKAITISAAIDTDWQTLLQAHQEEDAGWGQLAKAYGLAKKFDGLDLTGEQLLELKNSTGLGWGNIMHAQALANANLGVTFEQAIELLKSGKGWGDIRQELGLEAGPPPWAGKGKEKNKDKDKSGTDSETEESQEEELNNESNNNGKAPAWSNGNGNGNSHGKDKNKDKDDSDDDSETEESEESEDNN